MAVERPHFQHPFRWVSQSDGTVAAAVVEEDSPEDVASCVEVLLRTPLGFRVDDLPDFGTPEILFDQAPVDTDAIRQTLAIWEPRAVAAIEEWADAVDESIRHVQIELTGSED